MGKTKRNVYLNPRRGEKQSFDVALACEEWSKVFGANKNIFRTTPSMIDSLKPVQLRILYCLYMSDNHGMKNRKSAAVTGEVMGKYHPHGDASIYESIVKMCQPWKNHITLLDGHGNFGSIAGDSAAAMRYTEVKMSKFAMDCFFSDFERTNIPTRETYTGDSTEPIYLPSKYPVILFNPSFSGIGFGLASNIPPFNPKEVMDATITLIRDKKAKIRLIPDSPTGCDIIDTGYFDQINKTGKGKIMMQATYDIDYQANIVTFTSVPLQVGTKNVIASIVKMKKEGKLDEIVDVTDRTANSKVDFSLILKKDVNPDKFVEKLFKKKCGLREGFSCEIQVIDDFAPRLLGVKKILLEWIDYRRDCIHSIYNNYLMKYQTDYHMNLILMKIFNKDNIEKTIKISRNSKTKAEMKENLIKAYGITTLQAEAISNMRTSDFVKDKYKEYEEKDKDLTEKIKKVEKVLDFDHEVDKIIIKQLEDGIRKYGGPRLSRVIKEGEEELIPNTNYLIGISKDGYIKKISADEYVSIGSVGKTSSVSAIKINNRDNLLVFDSLGNISRVMVSIIPDMKYDENGIELARFLTTSGEIVTIMKESEVKECVNSNIMLVTQNGFGKKVSLSEFKNLTDQKVSITLNEGDKLVSAIPSIESDDIIVYTNFGDGIRLSTDEFKLYGKTAKGLNLISLKQNEKVIGMDVIDNTKEKDKLVYITTSGRLKMTKAEYFPVMKRKDEALALLSLESGEQLLNVFSVSGKERIECYRKKSKPVIVELKDVPIKTRISKAEKIVKTPKGDEVLACKLIR